MVRLSIARIVSHSPRLPKCNSALVKGPAPNRVCSWGIAPFALIVYSGSVATPHRWAGLFSPTPGSMVRRSSFALATSSREASSVVPRRLAAGGHLLAASR